MDQAQSALQGGATDRCYSPDIPCRPTDPAPSDGRSIAGIGIVSSWALLVLQELRLRRRDAARTASVVSTEAVMVVLLMLLSEGSAMMMMMTMSRCEKIS